MKKENNKHYLFFGVLFLFCIAMSFAINIPDYDLWARLLVGQHFFETFSLMKHDPFSYTPTHFWYDHEWGSSVIFYAVLKALGDSGLTLLKAFLAFLPLFFIYKTIKLKEVKTTNSYNILYYIFTFLALYPIFAGTIRCHMFTFAFFSLWIYLLEKVRLGERKWLFYFPLMMIVWNNLHGGCVSGIGLLFIYIVGEFLNKKPVKDYVVSFCLSCLATFINPYGPSYVLFLLKATTMKRPLITEWRSSFHTVYLYKYMVYKIFLITGSFVAIASAIKEKLNYEKLDKTKYILLACTAYLSIMHIKHQPFFIISAAAFLYDDFYSLFNSFVSRIRDMFNIKSDAFISKFVKIKETVVYGVILLATLGYLIQSDGVIKISQKKYPIYAVEFVRLNKIKGNLFINFTYGSYAAYKLFPNNKIVMDGRYEEVYDPSLIVKMSNFHRLKGKKWNELITNYNTDVIILEKSYPVFDKLKEDKNWKLVFEDKDFAVFVPAEKAKTNYTLPSRLDWFYDTNKFINYIDFKKK